MKKQVSLTAVLAIALVIVLAAGYFALVRPKQVQSGALATEIADLEAQATAAQATDTPETPTVAIDVADVFRLAKAMPDTSDMASIILELNSLARATGVEFKAIAPGEVLDQSDYHATPVALTFVGNYYDLTDFLYRLRTLVQVRDGVLDASGRLYTLEALELHESPAGFPRIEAVVTVAAYTFGSAPAAPGTPAAETETSESSTEDGSTSEETTTDTTETDTTETTTTDEAPAQPGGDGGQQAAGGSG